jgi:hypothetical protein
LNIESTFLPAKNRGLFVPRNSGKYELVNQIELPASFSVKMYIKLLDDPTASGRIFCIKSTCLEYNTNGNARFLLNGIEFNSFEVKLGEW